MQLNFRKLVIYRPGLLRCNRRERRPMEKMARFLSNYLDFGDWWSISTDDLATVIRKTFATETGSDKSIVIMEHREIVQSKI